MASEDILANRLNLLRGIVRSGFDDAPAQVQGFVLRVLEREVSFSDEAPLYEEKTVADCLKAVRFEGYPALARAGYSLARCAHSSIERELAERYLHCIEQQRGRPPARQDELARDGLALLGIVDGLLAISQAARPESERLQSAKTWVRKDRKSVV